MRVRKTHDGLCRGGHRRCGWFAAAAQPAVANGVTFLGEDRHVRTRSTLDGRSTRTHCASCHGVRLEGEPDWRRRKRSGRMPAPPHDATGPLPGIIRIRSCSPFTKSGLGAVLPDYESDMPAFGGC
ncbi:cytochrome c [Sinorhizobium meliloti]|nr:cytochrome c [Sinorhizobium meliloti]